jgi:hypothetical protein
MCLYVNEESKIKKADRDITCYKRLYLSNEGHWAPPFQGYKHRYHFGKVFRVWRFGVQLKDSYTTHKRRFSLPPNTKAIHEGLHSYRTPTDAVVHQKGRQFIIECIIPKGTRYIEGINGELVSLKLKPVRIVKWPIDFYE